MPAGHDHDHHDHPGHAHHHAPSRFGMAFAVGAALNVMPVAAQPVHGWPANSMALMADAEAI
jgi:cobalt-zinc-cadmium efflux system protein